MFRMLAKFYQNVLLPKMATKDDLAEMSSKMATKDDLAEVKANMATNLYEVEERLGKRIDRIAEVVTDVKTNHERRLRKIEDELGIESKPLTI